MTALRGLQVGVTLSLSTETCCSCGVLFAMTDEHTAELQRSHANFYCPNGHPQAYQGESDRDRARRLARELENATARNTRLSAEVDQAWASAAEHEKARRKIERQAKADARRLTNGICTLCHRSFAALKRHMDTKHPDQVVTASA